MWFLWFVAGCSGNIEEKSTSGVVPTPVVSPESRKQGAPAGESRAAAKIVEYQLFFTDVNNIQQGIKPYTRSVLRKGTIVNLPQKSMDMLYRGPQSSEKGLALTPCRSTAANVVSIEKGLAVVQLEGGCGGCGVHTIYDSISETLLQFEDISTVHVLDPEGRTEGEGLPSCLQP